MFENPYIQAVAVALLSAALFALYTKMMDKDEKKLTSKTLHVLIATMVSGFVFAFISNGTGSEELLNLPFENGGIADF